MNVGLQQEV